MLELTASDGAARTGFLELAGKRLELPAMLMYTKRGSTFNLTPDIAQPLGKGKHVDATQFMSAPTTAILSKHPQGARGFLGLQQDLLIATAFDSLVNNYTKWESKLEAGVRLRIHAGISKLSPSSYLGIIDTLRPDLYTSLADEVGSAASPKRVASSVDKTLRWLDDSVAQHAQQKLPGPGPCAPIMGGSLPEQRARSAALSAKRQVAGFTLCGFGAEAAFDAALVKAAVEQLPPHLPRFLLAPLSPKHLVEAVQAGVDVFDSSHAVSLAARGHALSLGEPPQLQAPSAAPTMEAAIKLPSTDARPAKRLRDEDTGVDGAAGASDGQEDSTKAEPAAEVRKERTHVLPSSAPAFSPPELNLWAPEFRADKQPLMAGCECYACQTHTRAYIHHLLEEHEMLAQVLLEVHNTWQLQQILAEVRSAIGAGTLQELRQKYETAA